eukprot:TRINITY_DN3670_c0_g1_i12.p1 TRINITY_DN3670_c0_g1~~TRINITY_DN3670_c0_g1_i12.p1  ORF type:complete len:210 (-),score=34.88 TRINITY_DN3670_c0_g1_i12:540-1169(-)
MSSILYMLTNDRNIGCWHKNDSDIMHYHHSGDPIRYWLLAEGQDVPQEHMLGPCHQYQLLVPKTVWKCSQLVPEGKGGYGLISEAVTPEWSIKGNKIMQWGELEQIIHPTHRQEFQKFLQNTGLLSRLLETSFGLDLMIPSLNGISLVRVACVSQSIRRRIPYSYRNKRWLARQLQHDAGLDLSENLLDSSRGEGKYDTKPYIRTITRD